MTKQKTFKKRVRARMDKTGERYAAARRRLLPEVSDGDGTDRSTSGGVHPATTAFRLLLDHAGHDLSEASLLVAGGGVGIGVFAFHYPEFSTLFLAGRHLWHDDLAFLQGLAERLGATLDVRRDRRREEGPHRPPRDGRAGTGRGVRRPRHAGAPRRGRGVLRRRRAGRGRRDGHRPDRRPGRAADRRSAGHADGGTRPSTADSRTRLLRLDTAPDAIDVAAAARAGIRACIDGFDDPPMRGSNFRVDGLDALAKRMRGGGEDAWSEVFPLDRVSGPPSGRSTSTSSTTAAEAD
ncbi:MAG: hypothetical protein U5J97_10180 [Trueperaceae bacterium]|nr:hypothetical protein [Trueperaceae bacterium]